MKKIIPVILIVLYASIVYAGAEIFMFHKPASSGEFTSFTDNFTGTNGAALNATHWNTSTADIQSNQARLIVFNSSLTVQGKEDITLKNKHSFKITMTDVSSWAGTLNTGDYVRAVITVQDSASVGTTHNKIYLTFTGSCADGDGEVCYSYSYTADCTSTDNSGSIANHYSGTRTSNVMEIRFDDSLTNVKFYDNTNMLGTGAYTISAQLGSTVRFAFGTESNVIGNMFTYFDDATVAVLP